VTNWVTIAAHTHVHQRTLTDTQAQVGYENAHYRGLRIWLRDEEAPGGVRAQWKRCLALARRDGEPHLACVTAACLSWCEVRPGREPCRPPNSPIAASTPIQLRSASR
jgi:hypothetical protein